MRNFITSHLFELHDKKAAAAAAAAATTTTTTDFYYDPYSDKAFRKLAYHFFCAIIGTVIRVGIFCSALVSFNIVYDVIRLLVFSVD